MREGVFGFVRDPVCLGQGGVRADVEFGLGVQPVPDPSHPDSADPGDSGNCGQRRFGGVHESGVHAVHQAAEYVAGGGPQDGKDGDRDDQPHDRVGQREAEGNAAGTHQHRQ